MGEVVVTGIGIISSIGNNVVEFEKALREGKSGICLGEVTNDRNAINRVFAPIRDLYFELILEKYSSIINGDILKKIKKYAKRTRRSISISILATLEAWVYSKLNINPIDSERIGLIVAGNNITQNLQYEQYKKFHDSPEYVSPSYALQYMDTDHVGTLSDIFQIHGEGFTIGGASASGTVGILKAYQLLSSGIVDVCLVVGAMSDLSPIELQAYYNIGAMGGKRFFDAPQKACRPFDVDHEGFIYGEASACIILEKKTVAKQRNANILATLLGGALVLDGNMLSNPSEQGEARVMKQALDKSGVSLNEISYINTHGSSSPLGDETELNAIHTVFGERIFEIWLNSTKSLTGHCMSSAGVVEAIASIIQMDGKFVHPNINLESPIDGRFRCAGRKLISENINTTMSNSFGFGGINSSIILRKGGG